MNMELESIGKNVRYNRKRNVFTQKELATRIKSSQDIVSKIETGKSNFRIFTLIKIARILEVPLALLLENKQKEVVECVE